MAFRVRIYDSQLWRQFDRQKPVGRFALQVGDEMVAEATAIAPRRGGWKTEHLFSKHYRQYLRRGNLEATIYVGNSASYAKYIHEGYPTVHGRPWLVFPASELRYASGYRQSGSVRLRSVSGYGGNPWLSRASRTVMARHGVV